MMDVVAEDLADPIPAVMKPAKPAGPGALRGEVSLTLNTRHALNLFIGRARSDAGARIIPGVNRFANYLEQVGIGVAADDPYADWTIIRIERLMATCEVTLRDWNQEMGEKLQSAPGVEIGVAQSLEPHVVSLQLTSPYAHWAARLIGGYDALVAVMLTGQYTGLFESSVVDEKLQAARRIVRHPFHVAQAYRFSGVTREDYEQKTARALEAIEKWGEVPDGILDRSEHPRFKFRSNAH